MRTLQELKTILAEQYEDCQTSACDLMCAGQNGDEHLEPIFQKELEDKEGTFYSTAHETLGLLIFLMSGKALDSETFTYKFKTPISLNRYDFVAKEKDIFSISTIGTEGVIWFGLEDGEEVDDDYYSTEHLMTIVNAIFDELKNEQIEMDGIWSAGNGDGEEIKDLLFSSYKK